jgi:DNA-binding NarL/FixJ family response regulator
MNFTAPSTKALRVMLVDDHAIVRQGYRRLLELEPDFRVVSEHADADAAYAELGRRPEPDIDVIVLDLSMPGRSGIDMLRRVRTRWPTIRVLAFSMHDSPAMVDQVLRAGADGYVSKSSEPGFLVDALRRVALGETAVLSPDLAERVVPSHVLRRGLGAAQASLPAEPALSAREWDILRWLVDGESVDQIAQRLHLSAKTVSNYQTAIRQKLGVTNTAMLLRLVQQRGWFDG